jgi:hypothetical protein
MQGPGGDTAVLWVMKAMNMLITACLELQMQGDREGGVQSSVISMRLAGCMSSAEWREQ